MVPFRTISLLRPSAILGRQNRPIGMKQPPLTDDDAAEKPTESGFWSKFADEKLVVSRFVFLRLLGICYFFAFHSFYLQALGLYGESGILPMGPFLSRIAERYGTEIWFSLPSIFWLNASNTALLSAGIIAMVAAVLLILGIAPTLSLIVLWVLYLSIANAGEVFMSYQWDILLLEVGFLAILLSPLQVISPVWCGKSTSPLWREPKPSPLTVWLLRFLLFRLMFSSGLVKLASQDPTWWNLTALTYHYQTQPLPTPLAWFADQLPVWFQKFSCASTLFLEIAVPIAIFAPRKLRSAAAVLLIFLQLLIAATGNYCFFNLLTIALCVLLLDDTCFGWLPKRLRESLNRDNETTTRKGISIVWSKAKRPALVVVAVFVLLTGTLQTLGGRLQTIGTPGTVMWNALEFLSGLHLVNTYGLFAVMTTTRGEIIVEGSNDGEHWLAYEFKYKPQDPRRAPPWVAPYQPRLDWQMWFASLSNIYGNPWFERFVFRLLEGSPDVLKLLEKNPFHDAPPRFIRARMFDYKFTDFAQKEKTGNWWQVELVNEYMPPVELADFK